MAFGDMGSSIGTPPADTATLTRLRKELELDDEQIIRALVEYIYTIQNHGPLFEVLLARQGGTEQALKYYALRRSAEASAVVGTA